MDLRYTIATIHLLTFGLGFASCWMRAAALRRLKDQDGVKDVLFADNLWGLAALLWILTGLWRAFGGLEKGSDFYLHNTAFLIKMSLFIIVFALEMKPMITLVKWRIQKGKGLAIDLSAASSMATTTYIQLFLLIPIVSLATAMARGIFY
jgi:putative membrane protein